MTREQDSKEKEGKITPMRALVMILLGILADGSAFIIGFAGVIIGSAIAALTGWIPVVGWFFTGPAGMALSGISMLVTTIISIVAFLFYFLMFKMWKLKFFDNKKGGKTMKELFFVVAGESIPLLGTAFPGWTIWSIKVAVQSMTRKVIENKATETA